jgi:hypothetical protein
MMRIITISVGVFLVVGLFFRPWADIVLQLVIGWFPFLGRVLPKLTIDWMGVLTAAFCLTWLLAGLHLFLRWFWKHVEKPIEPAAQTEGRWPLRWTAAMVLLVVLMFVAGIAAVGVSHQTGWLMTSPEPLTESGLRKAAERTLSTHNLHQIGIAAHKHLDAYETFPRAAIFDTRGRALHGWQTTLLPFIEQEALYQRIDLKIPWNHPANAEHFRTKVKYYLHPAVDSDRDPRGFALTHYAGNAKVLGGDRALTLKDFPDGTANTILAGEAAGNYRPWGHPINWRDPALGLNTTPDGFGSPFRDGGHFPDGRCQRAIYQQRRQSGNPQGAEHSGRWGGNTGLLKSRLAAKAETAHLRP